MAEARVAASPPKWDRAAIQAEIKRRGMTQLELARRYGLYNSAISQALSGGSFRGALAIADFLGVPVQELFPDRYRRRHRNHKPDQSAPASPIRTQISDRAEAA